MSHSKNSDNEGDEAIEQRLSWRMSPEESLSDWTLIITSTEDSCLSNEYHLHRTMLAVGPCKSDYFAALFRMLTRETSTNTSDIKLDKDAADAVPLMLDFIYTQELGMMTCEQAVSLRFLA
jgi:BTB/POZ domain